MCSWHWACDLFQGPADQASNLPTSDAPFHSFLGSQIWNSVPESPEILVQSISVAGTLRTQSQRCRNFLARCYCNMLHWKPVWYCASGLSDSRVTLTAVPPICFSAPKFLLLRLTSPRSLKGFRSQHAIYSIAWLQSLRILSHCNVSGIGFRVAGRFGRRTPRAECRAGRPAYCCPGR